MSNGASRSRETFSGNRDRDKPDKIIRIKECAGGICPYRIKDVEFFSCGKDRRYRKTTEEIPEWCPLEDYDEMSVV